ncbi:carboxypeptidase regulatory-like domain-containing protein [Planctomycetota bacterium]
MTRRRLIQAGFAAGALLLSWWLLSWITAENHGAAPPRQATTLRSGLVGAEQHVGPSNLPRTAAVRERTTANTMVGQSDPMADSPATGDLRIAFVEEDGSTYEGQVAIHLRGEAHEILTQHRTAVGGVELGGLPVGRYHLEAADRRWVFSGQGLGQGYDPAFRTDPVQVQIAANGLEQVTLVLKREPGLWVTVTDAETGWPVPDAKITVRLPGGSGFVRATQADGRAYVPGIREGVHEISCSADGYREVLGPTGPFLHGTAPHFEVTAGFLANGLALVVRWGRHLKGRVVTPDGTPVAATVIVRDRSEGKLHETVTDTDGTFHIRGLGREAHHVVAFHPHWSYAEVELPTESTSRPADLRLVLGRPAAISGLVLDPTGAPIAGARVEVMPAREDGPAFYRGDLYDEYRGRRRNTVSRSDGSYRLEGLRAGPMDLIAGQDGWATVRHLRVEIGVAGETKLDVVLRQGQSISGRIVNADGSPVTGASVSCYRLSPRRSGYQNVQSDETGRFVIDGLESGLYTVEVRLTAPDRVVEYRKAKAGTEDLVVTLPGVTVLVGEVRAPAGGEAVRLLAYWIDRPQSGGGGSSVQVDGDGRFSIQGIPTDTTEITLTAVGYAPHVIEAPDLVAGKAYEVRFSAWFIPR